MKPTSSCFAVCRAALSLMGVVFACSVWALARLPQIHSLSECSTTPPTQKHGARLLATFRHKYKLAVPAIRLSRMLRKAMHMHASWQSTEPIHINPRVRRLHSDPPSLLLLFLLELHTSHMFADSRAARLYGVLV
eukprot:2551955-Rhodomonas_salina.2